MFQRQREQQANVQRQAAAVTERSDPRTAGLRAMSYDEQVAQLSPDGAGGAVQRKEAEGPPAAAPAAERVAPEGGADATAPFRVAARVVKKMMGLLPSLPEETQQRLKGVLDRMLQKGVPLQGSILQDWGQAIREQAEKDKAPQLENELEAAHGEAIRDEQGGGIGGVLGGAASQLGGMF